MRKVIMVALLVSIALIATVALGTLVTNYTTTSEKTTVDVKVDFETYKQGEAIDIKIHVQGAKGEYFWLYVDGPDGRNILFRELGQVDGTANFKEILEIPIDAQIGTYNIMVEWSGHNMIQITFNVEVIPEFPFVVVPILLFATIFIVAVQLRRQKK